MRQCFLRFFSILLAIIAGLILAMIKGAPQAIFHADQSMMTSVIFILFVIVAGKIGIASWHEKDDGMVEFGNLSVRLSVMLGLLGTTIGLSMQAISLATEGSASLGALSTSLFTTGTGVAAALFLEILTYNLEVSTR